ncbi:MAG: alkaline phosphatase family protein [Anaerolineae bacterium]
MLTSKDPGQLGFYGFRNRADYGYGSLAVADSTWIRHERVWDILGRLGRPSVVVGVPQTYAVTPIYGHLVSDFLTPDDATHYTHPPELQSEIDRLVGRYEFDTRDFRTEDKDGLLKAIYRMTEKRLTLVEHLLRYRPWDFFMWVEIGLDRVQHAFWRFMDPDHPKYEADSPFRDAILDYYQYLDGAIGRMLGHIGEDAAVLVVSDHGAQPMEGGFCINEWLIREGYLVIKHKPPGIASLDQCEIDWTRTRAWGAGGYYGRVFLNVQGREPQGIIPRAQFEREREMLKARLEATTDHLGRPLGTVALKPEEIYREVRNIPPDLIVYFGDLRWRSVGSVGIGAVHTFENDLGPDEANHSHEGLFVFYHPARDLGGLELSGLHIEDVAPTMLAILGVEPPEDMEGGVIEEIFG